jgi:hypothetical protein
VAGWQLLLHTVFFCEVLWILVDVMFARFVWSKKFPKTWTTKFTKKTFPNRKFTKEWVLPLWRPGFAVLICASQMKCGQNVRKKIIGVVDY